MRGGQTQCSTRGSVLIAQVFNRYVGCGQHGIEESRRVKRALTIRKCNDYAVFQPQRLDETGNGLIVFHFSNYRQSG